MSTSLASPLQPALNSVKYLRAEMKKRVGKEGGTLNSLMLAKLDTIETTLHQIEPLGNMLNLVNQQTELAVHGFRALSRVQEALPPAHEHGNDDGTSETKGL